MRGVYTLKHQRIFFGVLLICVGSFFFLQQFQLPFLSQLLSWPSILVIIGAAFLIQGLFGKETGSIFPGALLFLLGIHFHSLYFFPSWWPRHWAMYTAIVGLSFLFLYSRTKKDGFIPAVILLAISLIGFFSSNFFELFGSVFHFFDGLWPLVLIVFGLYFIFRRK